VVDLAEDVVGGAGPSSQRPVVVAAEEVLVSSQPAAAPQERDALEGTTRAASLEIREAEEGTGATLSQGTTSGGAHALGLAYTPWVAAFEAGDDTEDDEEVAGCNTLERGLAWAHRAFDELILPAISVSFLALNNSFLRFSSSSGKGGLFLSRSEQNVAASGRRRVHATRELRAEWTQLEMQLIVARVAVAAAVVSEASTRTSLEAAR
jgi:hypothetical protein